MRVTVDKAHAELLQHFLTKQLLPDEDAETHRALRDALFLNLMSGTSYERILAEQLVTLEWEALRHRRMRDYAQFKAVSAVGGSTAQEGLNCMDFVRELKS